MSVENSVRHSLDNIGPVIQSPLAVAWAKGKQAAWENRFIGICLWLVGILIVVGYYRVEPVREVLNSLGDWKIRSGWIFAVISTSVFGGLLPVLLPRLFAMLKLSERPVSQSKHNFWMLLISNGIFWGYKGWEIDTFYRVQSWLFGNAADFSTIAAKTIFDMAVFAPTIGLFNCVLFYIWRDNDYSLIRTRRNLGPNWYTRKVLPALISNAAVWTPAVIVIYSLPPALQLPVQNLILCAWVLVLVFFTQAEPTPE